MSVETSEARPPFDVYMAVALVSATALAAQIALTRLFSITLWHHFAHLVIGVALLGFGAAGSFLAVRMQAPKVRARDAQSLLAHRTRLGAIASLAASVALSLLKVDSLSLFTSPVVALELGLIMIVAAVPFFGAGLTIGTALSSYRGRAAGLYAADLLGAGIGALVAVQGLVSFGAMRLLFACSVLMGFSALILSLGSKRELVQSAAALSVLVLPFASYGHDDRWFLPAVLKELNGFHRPDIGKPGVEYRSWTPQGRIDVGLPIRWTPLLGGEFNGAETTIQRVVTQDGSAPTALYELVGEPAAMTFIPALSTSAVWWLRGATPHTGPPPAQGPNVLVIGVGGGIDVLIALAYGARRVTGAEVNPGMLSLLTRRYLDFTGRLAVRPDVRLVLSDGRAFVRSSSERFDVIQLSGVDTFAALSSGAYSLAEAYVYTAEAFDDYLSHLAPGGCISMSRLILEPPRETLRLAGTAAEVMRRRGEKEPWKRIAVVGGRVWATLLACDRPIDGAALARLRAFSARSQVPSVFDPEVIKDDPWGRLLAGDEATRAKLIASYPYRLEPATDEAPFFFDYYRYKSLVLLKDADYAQHPYAYGLPVGHALLLIAFVLTLALGALGILLPLQRLAAPESARRPLVYFAALGFGFLLVESALLQRLTLLLGHPTYALTVVLSGLLIASGIGSAFSRSATKKPLRLSIMVPVVLLAAAAFSYVVLPRLTVSSFAGRVALALAFVAPLGFVLGMPFPVGLERVRLTDPRLVPWAFGVNAFFTVVAASLAPLIAMELGFSVLFVVAAAGYAVAFRAAALPWRRSGAALVP